MWHKTFKAIMALQAACNLYIKWRYAEQISLYFLLSIL